MANSHWALGLIHSSKSKNGEDRRNRHARNVQKMMMLCLVFLVVSIECGNMFRTQEEENRSVVFDQASKAKEEHFLLKVDPLEAFTERVKKADLDTWNRAQRSPHYYDRMEVDPERDVLLIIDMQRDFVPAGPLNRDCSDQGSCGMFSCTAGEKASLMIENLVESFGSKGASIIATKDYHPHNHASFGRFKSPVVGIAQHCVWGKTGSRLYEPIRRKLQKYAHTTEIVFKGMDPEIDSFGAFSYSEQYAKCRDLRTFDNKGKIESHKIKECENDLTNETAGAKGSIPKAKHTGSYSITPPSFFGFPRFSHYKQTLLNDIDAFPPINVLDDWKQIMANPDTPLEEVIKRMLHARGMDPNQDYKKEARLFVVGLALDFCVFDTAFNAVHAHGFHDVNIVWDAGRPVQLANLGTVILSKMLHSEEKSEAVTRLMDEYLNDENGFAGNPGFISKMMKHMYERHKGHQRFHVMETSQIDSCPLADGMTPNPALALFANPQRQEFKGDFPFAMFTSMMMAGGPYVPQLISSATLVNSMYGLVKFLWNTSSNTTRRHYRFLLTRMSHTCNIIEERYWDCKRTDRCKNANEEESLCSVQRCYANLLKYVEGEVLHGMRGVQTTFTSNLLQTAILVSDVFIGDMYKDLGHCVWEPQKNANGGPMYDQEAHCHAVVEKVARISPLTLFSTGNVVFWTGDEAKVEALKEASKRNMVAMEGKLNVGVFMDGLAGEEIVPWSERPTDAENWTNTSPLWKVLSAKFVHTMKLVDRVKKAPVEVLSFMTWFRERAQFLAVEIPETVKAYCDAMGQKGWSKLTIKIRLFEGCANKMKLMARAQQDIFDWYSSKGGKQTIKEFLVYGQGDFSKSLMAALPHAWMSNWIREKGMQFGLNHHQGLWDAYNADSVSCDLAQAVTYAKRNLATWIGKDAHRTAHRTQCVDEFFGGTSHSASVLPGPVKFVHGKDFTSTLGGGQVDPKSDECGKADESESDSESSTLPLPSVGSAVTAEVDLEETESTSPPLDQVVFAPGQTAVDVDPHAEGDDGAFAPPQSSVEAQLKSQQRIAGGVDGSQFCMEMVARYLGLVEVSTARQKQLSVSLDQDLHKTVGTALGMKFADNQALSDFVKGEIGRHKDYAEAKRRHDEEVRAYKEAKQAFEAALGKGDFDADQQTDAKNTLRAAESKITAFSTDMQAALEGFSLHCVSGTAPKQSSPIEIGKTKSKKGKAESINDDGRPMEAGPEMNLRDSAPHSVFAVRLMEGGGEAPL